MAGSNPYPLMGTDLQGNPIPPLYKNGKINPQPSILAPPKPAPGPSAPTDAGDRRQGNSTQAQIKAMQQFLKNRGYNITVDGVRGPETNAVVAAFHNHVPPAKYNSRGAKTTPTTDTPPATTDSSTPPKGPPTTKRTPAGTTTTAPPAIPSDIMDPRAYAAGAVNAQYDPQIAELLRQEAQQKAQGTQDQADIQNWYNQLLGVVGKTGAANASTGQAAVGSYDDASNTALNQLFGGASASPSADEAQAFHDIQAGALRGNIEDQAAFDKNLKLIFTGAGAQARTAQLNKDNNAYSDLAAKLLDLRGAKGQAYTSAYQQGVQAATQQRAAEQASQLAAQLAPSQVAVAKANATSAVAQSKTAAAIARVNLAKATAEAKAAQMQAGGTWNLAVPSQRGALQQSFETNVLGPKGGLKMDPTTAWSNLQLQLNAAGLTGNPQAEAIMLTVFLQGLHTAHSQGRLGGYAWNGKKVVKTGNKYVFDPKTKKRMLVNSKGRVIPDYVPKS